MARVGKSSGMNIFVGWSQERSREAAVKFADWIKSVIQSADVFISTEMAKGVQWPGELMERLKQSRYGVVFVTPENRNERWLNFEAGAIASALDRRMAPVVIGLEKSDLEPPLGNYQCHGYE